MHYSRSHDAVIRVYDAAGNVIETYQHANECRRAGCARTDGANPKGIKEGRSMHDAQTLALIHAVASPILILLLSKMIWDKRTSTRAISKTGERVTRFGADSGLQLSWGIALDGLSANGQPLRLIQPCLT